MVCATKTVKKALRLMGFEPMRRGKATSHQLWHDQSGRTVQLVASNGCVPDNYIYDMTNEMRAKGICTPQEFKALLRAA